VEETADARATDGNVWVLPEQTQLRSLLPFLSWSQSAAGQPWELPLRELEPLLLMIARVGDKAVDLVRFSSHAPLPAAMRLLVTLIDKGFPKEPPVTDVPDFHRRVHAFFEQHDCGPAFDLRAADFGKVQAGYKELPPKLQWLAELSPSMAADLHPQRRCVAWSEWCYVAGDCYAEAHISVNSEMCVLVWSAVQAMAEYEPAVKNTVRTLEKAEAAPGNTAAATFKALAKVLALPLASAVINCFKRTVWPVELWALSGHPLSRVNEVPDRLIFQVKPMEVMATRFGVMMEHAAFAVLKEATLGAGDAQGMQLVRDVADEPKLKSSRLQLVRDVCEAIADIRPAWAEVKMPVDRCAKMLATLREKEQREKLTTSARVAASGGADAAGTGAPLTASRQREWSNVISGENSKPFTAIVAAVDAYADQIDECFLEVMDIIFRGVKEFGPSHPCQDFMMQSEGAAVPAVHACFAQWAPLRRKQRIYFAVRGGLPGGGDVPDGLLTHEMLKSTFDKFQVGDLDDDKFDYLLEAWRAQAAALGCQPDRMPVAIPSEEWLMELDHYDVASEYLTAIMSARGLRAMQKGYAISDVAKWCKAHWRQAPLTCITTLREHKSFARQVFRQALRDMGDHAIKARKLGRLDQGRLQYHVPPSSRVWTLIKGADVGVQEQVRMRTNTPAMANALVWAMGQAHGSGAAAVVTQPRAGVVLAATQGVPMHKLDDHQLTAEQLDKREQNRKALQAKRDARERDAARYKQTRLDGTAPKGGGRGTGKGDPSKRQKGGGEGRSAGCGKRQKEGKGRGGKGNSKKPRASWNHEERTVTVDGVVFDTVNADGKRVSEVLGIPEPVCYGWCVKAGACTQPNHADHQGGDEAVAHRNITEELREEYRTHFRRE
jgi:hypothetical protein